MATSSRQRDSVLDLPLSPEVPLHTSLAELDRTRELLERLSEEDWYLPTVLPFWRVCEVVGHLYVVGGFFTSVADLSAAGVLDRDLTRWAGRRFDLFRAPIVSTLHHSNIQAPRLFCRLTSQHALTHLAQTALRLLSRRIEHLNSDDLARTVPLFRWRLSMPLTLAILTRELAVHRWEIEQTLDPASKLDPESADILPLLLWSAAPLVSRPARHLSGSVATQVGDRRLNWWVDSGMVQPAMNGKGDAAATAVVEGEPDDFVLVALGRLPLSRLKITGDLSLGRGFLSAFSYEAGPVTLFNL